MYIKFLRVDKTNTRYHGQAFLRPREPLKFKVLGDPGCAGQNFFLNRDFTFLAAFFDNKGPSFDI